MIHDQLHTQAVRSYNPVAENSTSSEIENTILDIFSGSTLIILALLAVIALLGFELVMQKSRNLNFEKRLAKAGLLDEDECDVDFRVEEYVQPRSKLLGRAGFIDDEAYAEYLERYADGEYDDGRDCLVRF